MSRCLIWNSLQVTGDVTVAGSTNLHGPTAITGQLNLTAPLLLSQPGASGVIELSSMNDTADSSRIVFKESGNVVWTLFNNRSTGGQAHTLMIAGATNVPSLTLDQSANLAVAGMFAAFIFAFVWLSCLVGSLLGFFVACFR